MFHHQPYSINYFQKFARFINRVWRYLATCASSSSVCLSCQAIRWLLRQHCGVLSVRLVVGWGDNLRQYASSTVVVRTHRAGRHEDPIHEGWLHTGPGRYRTCLAETIAGMGGLNQEYGRWHWQWGTGFWRLTLSILLARLLSPNGFWLGRFDHTGCRDVNRALGGWNLSWYRGRLGFACTEWLLTAHQHTSHLTASPHLRR